MEIKNIKNKILVIGSEGGFLSSVTKLLETDFEVITSKTGDEALSSARLSRPKALVLGFLEPRGTSFSLHQKLRSGWITKHIPLIVVDVQNPAEPQKSWSQEEAMQMEADDYISIVPKGDLNLSRLLESGGLTETIRLRLQKKSNLLKAAILDPDTFCITWEQIPGRGAFEIQQEQVFDNVIQAASGGKVHGVSVTDNPGGNPALSTEMICAQIKKANMEPVVHLACRDKNRNTIESMLYGLAAEGVRNVLLLTGDYPSPEGFEGTPKPVFDLDPITALRLITLMNNGLEHKLMGKTVTLAPSDIFAGVCVSPYKQLESELMMQYAKLAKKIECGAQFIIPQVGYDMRKMDEILQWLNYKNLKVPVLANIYILPYSVSKFMNANNVPGCVVTDKMVADLAAEAAAPDKGKAARLLRAAKHYAIAKGMGCAGAHLAGHNISYQMVEYIIDKGEELSKGWKGLVEEFDYPQKEGFYFFEKNAATGLNSDTLSVRPSRRRIPLIYRISRLAHSIMFNEKSLFFRMFQPTAARIDSKPRAKRNFGWLEHQAKTAMFGCMNCGDCGLFDVAYICPMSQCPKQQRNGPCGGSYEGWCEVYPGERECIWVQAYNRLKRFGEEGKIEQNIVPPCNWALTETSSWLNFYLGRDHTAKKLGITPPKKRGKKAEVPAGQA